MEKILKLDRFETHDRYKHFIKQDFSIEECCQNLIDQRPFGNHPFYIFAHTRTDDCGVKKRLIWQPRLTKPTPQSNSMLFKAYPGTDEIKIMWMIPARELWKQFTGGNITENKLIVNSIITYQKDKQSLAKREDDDLSDEEIDAIYKEIAQEANRKKMMDTLWKNMNHTV